MNTLVHLKAGVLQCPVCEDGNLHQRTVEVYQRWKEDAEHGGAWGHISAGLDVIMPMEKNPSPRRDGVRIRFMCEHCSLAAAGPTSVDFAEVGPVMTIIQHKGETIMEWENGA